MNILIVYAHPNTNTFSNQILETCIAESKRNGHHTEVRDLYRIGFNPVLQSSDFTALKTASLPDEIRIEQQYISTADILIFVYPLWWGGMPAILKGYIDRIFLSGFAYVHNDSIHQSLLSGKNAMVFCTQGSSLEEYAQNGMTESITRINETGIFSFVGLEPLAQRFYVQNDMKDLAGLESNLNDVRAVLNTHLKPVYEIA
jgi:NAD(P)H dehydrogenase (quinone)